MPILNLKYSIDYLKRLYKTGSPKQREWCFEMLKERWDEMCPDEQLDLIFDIPSKKKEMYG